MAFYPQYIPGHFTQSINLKSATSTLIVPPRSGQKFVVLSCYVLITAITGGSTGPTIVISGGAGPTNMASAAVGVAAVGGNVPLTFYYTAVFPLDVGTTGLSVTVTVASDATTHTGDVVVVGYYK